MGMISEEIFRLSSELSVCSQSFPFSRQTQNATRTQQLALVRFMVYSLKYPAKVPRKIVLSVCHEKNPIDWNR